MHHLARPPMAGHGDGANLADSLRPLGDPLEIRISASSLVRCRPGDLQTHELESVHSSELSGTRAVEPDDLAKWIEEQATAFSSRGTQAGRWMAETLLELAATARFLGARTPEQFETRKETLEQDHFSVRPCPRIVGRYQAWDIVDGRGKVVRACTDLFDAMMWIQQRLAASGQ